MANRKTKAERAIEAQLEIEKEITSVPTEQNSADKEIPSDEPIHSLLENHLKKYVRPLRRL
jgi:hypothetical protein